ncbi:MAG: hypothetical protein AVDCRST_MAG91-631, partial [uncultured Sphingomonadaceae bacterium]
GELRPGQPPGAYRAAGGAAGHGRGGAAGQAAGSATPDPAPAAWLKPGGGARADGAGERPLLRAAQVGRGEGGDCRLLLGPDQSL